MKKLIWLVVLAVGITGFGGCAAVYLGAGAAGGALGYKAWSKSHRECPYCKKNIKNAASVCPYCQRDVEPIVAEKEEE